MVLILSKLRPGRNNKWRVAPVATYEQGRLLVSEQVEVKRPGNEWVPASDTWQTLLAFNGKQAVRERVLEESSCWVERIS